MMRDHMLANMRDHLEAIHGIHRALASRDFELAADIGEQRLGMSSLASHGAEHMAPHMPAGMRAIGTAMHRAASRFAATARESAIDGDMARALRALSEVTDQCVACHAGYRVR